MVYDRYIEGKTVRLRSVEERDAEETFRMRSDPEKSKFFHAAEGTVEDQLEYIKKQRIKEGDYLFLIEDKAGNAIGMKGLYNYNANNMTIESGRFVAFGSQVQNMEALLLSCDFAFYNLHVNQIHMAALANNNVMLGIQKKLGAEAVYKENLDEFDFENIHSILTKETYAYNRPKISRLIDRFAER